MFWGGFFVGVIFLLVAGMVTWILWDMLQKYIEGRIEATDNLADAQGETLAALQRKDECLVNDVLALEDMNETLNKRLRELQDRIDYFIGISPVGGMLSAKIVQEGIAIHKATDKGAPFDGVTKMNDVVTIYEVKYVNDVQWAKIGENKWICGGWRPRDPKGG
jgi:hypothetical protein